MTSYNVDNQILNIRQAKNISNNNESETYNSFDKVLKNLEKLKLECGKETLSVNGVTFEDDIDDIIDKIKDYQSKVEEYNRAVTNRIDKVYNNQRVAVEKRIKEAEEKVNAINNSSNN